MRANREKKERKKIKITPKQKKIIILIVVIVLFVGIYYGRTIFKLQIENKKLKEQQEKLKAEESALTKELKNIHTKDYIQEQARKQLRLLNKDEILFIFEENEDEKK